jgi:hypothetical protein
MEKKEILETLKNKHNYLIKTNEKIRYSEGNFCVECLSGINYHPHTYPYREYLCHRCHYKFPS